MSRLEDRVWEELVSVYGARLDACPVRDEPHRRRWSPLMARGALGVVAAAVVGVLVIVGGSSPSAAFAVTHNPDGTVTLTIHELTNSAAVNTKLAQLGVRARVVPLRQNCPTALNMGRQYLQPNTQPWSEDPSTNGPVGSWTVGIIPDRIPVGHTLVFGLDQTSDGWQMANAIVSGPGPNCSSPDYLVGISQAPPTAQQMTTSPAGETTTRTTTTAAP